MEALQDISDNILKEYSEKLTGNGEKKNTFKLELDQHIVMSMQRMMSLTVVRYSARTEYIQYLLSYHICQLVQNEFEKFHSQILKKIVASARATSALISPLNPTFSSSQISTTSSPLSRFSPSRDRCSITTSSSLKIIGSNGSSSSSYDRKNDINNNEDIIQSYHTAPSDSDILALDCLAQCLQLSMEYRTHSDHSLKLKLSLYQIEKCSTAFSQSDRYSSGLAGHVLYDINSDNNFLKGNITCVGGDSFERNLRYLNVTKNCSNDAIISNVIDRKRKVEHSHDKFDS